MTNRLIHSQSPYLLAHAKNPVAWYEWSEEPFEVAKKENKLVFLSVGYHTCHWCHVMEAECFEDNDVAALLNEQFISIKVDREQRPDVDKVFMDITQMISGRGGWPNTLFLTPEKRPVFAGTYFPKYGRMGSPGFLDVLKELSRSWMTSRDKLESVGAQLVSRSLQMTTAMLSSAAAGGSIDPDIFVSSFVALGDAFDTVFGGFDDAPKFPTPHHLLLLLRLHLRFLKDERNEENRNHDISKSEICLKMVQETLKAIRRGGIYDQIGGGFARYSTDASWTVPHFEKMLYDQAYLISAFSFAYRLTQDRVYRETIRSSIDYVRRDLMDSETGAFYCGQDADSEGVEGKYYLWHYDEMSRVLSDPQVCAQTIHYLSMKPNGNCHIDAVHAKLPSINNKDHQEFDLSNVNIPRLKLPPAEFPEMPDSFPLAKKKLLAARYERIPPSTDDKVLSGWNGFMISALVSAFPVGGIEVLQMAERASNFIWNNLRDQKTNRLYRCWRRGQCSKDIPATAEDYSSLIFAFTGLWEVSGNVEHLERAVILAELFVKEFWREKLGVFGMSSSVSGTDLICEAFELVDNAFPNANSNAVSALSRLFAITGDEKWRDKATKIVNSVLQVMESMPKGFSGMLCGVDQLLDDWTEVCVVLNEKGDIDHHKLLLEEIFNSAKFARNCTVCVIPYHEDVKRNRIIKLVPSAGNRSLIHPSHDFAMFVCKNQTCSAPIVSVEELRDLLSEN